ncbi:N2,N2-dimethylguanosine tRNA methyltransferase family protein [Trichomonas vaginalis G3]|uniref:tRNA (guanine(26)-N(2))-dimethyltransferase n=1 Tax=Trichomonas vaginalis (strain ATCC PRA-98 / G3) TaxID=412133 RepID=A2FDH4_TRIV3|nr:N2, N2-dimethylguanosine tRNA methyltransferase family [Trichomonas vaginalis G3]EAX97051.1 N2,N2-dimethylguanosine tRNA methyltransferase family protein [Trichomonas vaginalis G3]KAI5515727.1 N2, N2-dimethylguanosine tRNA methyltransferase family [Trichomonas vaginalis G3]|eukprot:XP_001309981.1 N2,N2-dimethylguanosine tRNA methyltransferase family protein [Trichomonas vaginalis G3]
MGQDESIPRDGEKLAFSEGSANIYYPSDYAEGDVFYNPVQQFNRDLTCAVIQAYRNSVRDDISIFEAFAASGLRSIRYAKEITGIKEIISNDLDPGAVEIIKRNIAINKVSNIVTASQGDARDKMLEEENKYQVLDLDPYSTAAPFLEAAVKAATNGALLCITSTDGRTLCGVQPDVAYSWYGCVPLNVEFEHEFGIRCLLTTLMNVASRLKRSIEPLICLAANFYIRIFVRIHDKPIEAKKCASYTSIMTYSTDSKSFWIQPLGTCTMKSTNAIVRPPNVEFEFTRDPYTNGPLKLGGPFYNGPLHNKEFIDKVLQLLPTMKYLGTIPRIEGVLNCCRNEIDAPFYYDIGALTTIIKASCPPRALFYTQIEKQGYHCSLTHCDPGKIKTDAPPELLWDICRKWYFNEGKKLPEADCTARKILEAKPKFEVTMDIDQDIEYRLKREKKICRYYQNPTSNFGPKAAAKKKHNNNDKK